MWTLDPSLYGQQAALEWFIDCLWMSEMKTELISAPGSAASCATTTATTTPVTWSHDKHLHYLQ